MDPDRVPRDPIQDKASTTYWRAPQFPRVKSILGRWWWVAMPLLGLVCAEAYVTPQVADRKDAKNRILKYEQDKIEELSAVSITADNQLFAVEVVIDTLYLPELRWSQATRDSLVSVRRGIEGSFPLLETQIDTLKGQILRLQEPIQLAELTRDQRESEIEQHDANIASLGDSLVWLAQEREALADRLYRLENPDEFDRSRGLIDPRRESEGEKKP